MTKTGHLQKLLLIVAMMFVPWVTQSQQLSDYSFSTGVDTSRWITLSSSAGNVWTSYTDDAASGPYNIGFSFPFGEGVYSQFSVSSNGIFNLGSGGASTGTTAGQFTSSYYNTSLPKICGIARDMSTGTNGYVHYEMTGTAPNRVFVCEFALTYTYGSSYSADVKWQVQLLFSSCSDPNQILLSSLSSSCVSGSFSVRSRTDLCCLLYGLT